MTSCIADNLPDTMSDYSGSLSASFYGQCDSTDLERYDGMTYSEIEQEELFYGSAFCRQQTSVAYALIYKEAFTSTTTSTVDGITTTSTLKVDRTTKRAKYDENGRSCQKKRKGDEIFFEDGCVNYQHIEAFYNDSTTPSGSFFTWTTRDLVQEIGEHD